jgi:hypothetical protein
MGVGGRERDKGRKCHGDGRGEAMSDHVRIQVTKKKRAGRHGFKAI